MHYYKSSELADLYGVSRRTVTNWIKQTQEGRLNLELYQDGNDFFIAKSDANRTLVKELVQERRKYLNTRSLKQVTPSPKFYKIFSERQVHDIIHSLNIHKELPLQYTYMDYGAKLWDDYATKQYATHNSMASLMYGIQLVKANNGYLDAVLADYENVNIVDLGVGNALPVKELLAHLIEKKKLKRYIAIDISPDILKIAESNIHKWFGNEVKFEGYNRDITYESFADIIAEPVDKRTHKHTSINIVLLLGGVLSNFHAPEDVIRIISKSMGQNDIFGCTFKISSPGTKERVGFITKYHPRCKFVLDLLGIDESYYDFEIGFEEKEQLRYGRIRLKHALNIKFQLPKGDWIVDLHKDETILTVRANNNDPFNTPKRFYDNGLHPLLTSQTIDHEAMMLIADLRRGGPQRAALFQRNT